MRPKPKDGESFYLYYEVAGIQRARRVNSRLTIQRTLGKPQGVFYAFPNIKFFDRPSSEIVRRLLDEAGLDPARA